MKIIYPNLLTQKLFRIGEEKLSATESKRLWQEIKQLRLRLSELEDEVLSPDDKRALAQARRELKAGKTTSHGELAGSLKRVHLSKRTRICNTLIRANTY